MESLLGIDSDEEGADEGRNKDGLCNLERRRLPAAVFEEALSDLFCATVAINVEMAVA